LPGEAISRLDALRLYTFNNAWYNFEEAAMGSLEPGKLADLVVLDRPFLDVSDEEIKRIASLLTLVGGRPVFAAGPFAGLE
jgi:predicted amidohydrolase YtcJ